MEQGKTRPNISKMLKNMLPGDTVEIPRYPDHEEGAYPDYVRNIASRMGSANRWTYSVSVTKEMDIIKVTRVS